MEVVKAEEDKDELVNVPVKQQDEDGSSGDYGEVEIDGQGQGGGAGGGGEQQREPEMVEVKVKSEVSDETGRSTDGKEKTLLTYRRRAGGANSVAVAPPSAATLPVVTPKVEENGRPVRANRGMKRRYPGDESDETDAARKPARVRSMTEVFAESARYSTPSEQTAVGDIGQKGGKRMRPKKRGRPSRGNGSKKVLRGVTEESREGNLFVCKHEGCDKAFAEAGALYRHARVHGDRPYVCHYEGCNRRFLERSKLKRHYLIHTGEKSFVCLYEGCGKAFSLDFNLRSHMKTHTGEYHECPHEGCEKKYCQNYKLRAHMCKDHNMVATVMDNHSKNNEVLEALKEVTPEMKAAKKQEKLNLLLQRKEKLDRWREDRKKRIQELEIELERETRELGKIEKALRKVDREKDQLEVDESEFTSSDDSIEPDIEQANCEDREVLVFAQKLPTADHGARLVHTDPSDVLVSRPSSSSGGYLLSSNNNTIINVNMNAKLNNSSTNNNTNNNNGNNKNNNNSNSNNLISSSSSGGTVGTWSNANAGAGGADSTAWSTNHKLLLMQQTDRPELPVTHLFSFQEQPCLVD